MDYYHCGNYCHKHVSDVCCLRNFLTIFIKIPDMQLCKATLFGLIGVYLSYVQV